MNKLFKWLSIPSGATVEVKAYQTWAVRWTSRYGQYSGNTKPEVECFTTEEDARKFAKELKRAFALLRHTSDTFIGIEQQ